MRICAAFAALFALASGTCIAQSQSSPESQAPAGAVSPMAPLLQQDARQHSDADARACLDLGGNVAIIKCAEPFRWHKGESNARR